jgi:hypothetical protein
LTFSRGRVCAAIGLLAVLAALAALAACSDPAPTGGAPSQSPSQAIGFVASPPASTAPSATATPSTGLAVEADPGLFTVIGGSSDGLNFVFDPDTTARVAADPDLARNAVGVAIGLYTVTGQQPVQDFAIVSVVRLRDPSVGDDWFRSYRDSYDEAACAQAGGVARNSEATIGTNLVFIGGCAGGAFTYHVRLQPRGIVVSITAAGPARLGERLAGDVGR